MGVLIRRTPAGARHTSARDLQRASAGQQSGWGRCGGTRGGLGCRPLGWDVDVRHCRRRCAYLQAAWEPAVAGPGRGWVMVRAARLEARALLEALEAGQFYSSTGVELTDYAVNSRSMVVTVKKDAWSSTAFSSSGRVGALCRNRSTVRPSTSSVATRATSGPRLSKATAASRGVSRHW